MYQVLDQIKTHLLCQYYLLLKTYLLDNIFYVKQQKLYTRHHIKTDSVHSMHIWPTNTKTDTATFPDDTGMLSKH